MEKTDKQLEVIEHNIRTTSLYGTETTDILVEAAMRGAEQMRKMKNDTFIAMLDSINYNAFPNIESYIGFLKDCVKEDNSCFEYPIQ